MPSSPEDLDLITRYRQTKDPCVGDAIIRRWHRWLCGQAIEASRRHRLDFDEALQACQLGLLDAVERFEVERGLGIRTYAGHRIRRYVADAVRERRPSMEPASWGASRRRKLTRAIDAMRRADEPVADQTVAAKLGWRPSTVRAMRVGAEVSMDATFEGTEGELGNLHDLYAGPDQLRPDHIVTEKLDGDKLRAVIGDALRALSPRRAEIVRAWLDEDCAPGAMTEIARRLGITTQAVSLSINTALPQMAQVMRRNGVQLQALVER